MDLSKLTAPELKDLCKQFQNQISEIETKLNKSWFTKLKESLIALCLTSIIVSPVIWGIITLVHLLTNR